MKRSDWLFLGLLILVCFCSWFNHQGILLSDEYLYSVEAYKITQGTFELSGSAFHNRFGQLVPMALLIKLLGGAPHVLSLWSLIAFLLLLAGVYRTFRKEAPRLGLLIVALLGLNPALLRFSADVSHDLVMSSFAGLALLALWKEQRMGGASGIGFSILLFLAFLTKMAVVYVFPFLLWVAWRDWRAGVHKRFWLQAIVSGVALGVIYLGVYGYLTGDILYRWHGINAEHNVSPYSYYGKPWTELFLRATVGPPVFLLKSMGYNWLLLLAAFGLPLFRKEVFVHPLRFFMSAGIILLIMHWWGSSSFTSYNPVLLHERMWLLLILPFTVVTGYLFYEVFPSGKWQRWLPRATFLLLVGWQVFQLTQYQQKTAFFPEQRFLQELPKDRKTVILTDSILVDKPLVHFAFQMNDSVELVDWNRVQEGFQADYMLYNYRRAGIMEYYFERPVPGWVLDLRGEVVVETEHVFVRRVMDVGKGPG